MTGAQRIDSIRRHVTALNDRRMDLFFRDELSILPCWGDEMDALIAAELDRVPGPLRLGLWFWGCT